MSEQDVATDTEQAIIVNLLRILPQSPDHYIVS